MSRPLLLGLAVAVVLPACKDEQKSPVPPYRSVAKDAAPVTDASPWAGLRLAPGPSFAKGETIWAAAVNDRDRWALNRFRVEAAVGDTLMVQRRADRRAPKGLARPLNTEIPGPKTPVLFASDRAEYGVVVGSNAGKAKVAGITFSGASIEHELSPEEILPLSGDTLGFGAPTLYQDSKGEVRFGIVAGRGEEQIHLLRGVGKNSRMVGVPSDRVRLIDYGEPLRKGQKVWFRSPTVNHDNPEVEAGVIHVPLGKSGYSVKALDGEYHKVPWAFVAPR